MEDLIYYENLESGIHLETSKRKDVASHWMKGIQFNIILPMMKHIHISLNKYGTVSSKSRISEILMIFVIIFTISNEIPKTKNKPEEEFQSKECDDYWYTASTKETTLNPYS